MAGFSDYLEDKVLDHVFGGNAYWAGSTCDWQQWRTKKISK